jgi:hypothetical protein
MYAIITYTEWTVVGQALQREKTYTCNNATATVTETINPSDISTASSDLQVYCPLPDSEVCAQGTNVVFADWDNGWPPTYLMVESSVEVTYDGQPCGTIVSVNQASRTVTVTFNIAGLTHGGNPWRAIIVSGTVYVV